MKKILRAPGFMILSEAINGNDVIEVQLLKTGSFRDPRYGKFAITRKMFSEMIKNFKGGVRGQDISLDYIHKADDVAAAWIKEVFERNTSGESSELWAKVELTGSGKKSLSEKEFRYISADFDPKYIDNEKGEEHGCVLEGAALTNRPVIKGMAAIQLSEELTGEEANLEGAKPYDEISKELSDMSKYVPLIQFLETNKMSVEDVLKKLKPSPEDSMAMTEQEAKELADAKAEAATLKQEKEATEQKLQLSEKNGKFDKMMTEGKAVEAQRKAYIAGDMDEFAKLAVKIKLSEEGDGSGHGSTGDSNKKDVEDEISEEANKLVASEKIQLSEAIKRVSAQPKFAKELAKKFE